MKLIQKRFLLGTTSFEIGETSVQVHSKQLMNEARYEVAFFELSRAVSYHRSAPIQWLVFAVIFGAVFLFSMLGLILEDWVPDKSGMIGSTLIFLAAALGCAFTFYRRRIDIVIMRTVGGDAGLVLHRTTPTEVHVREFVEIVRERVQALYKNQPNESEPTP